MNGILPVDKPEGWTSHDVIAKLRGVLCERKLGHSGTLDPMATGLLVVFAGRATRAVQFAENDEKEYIAGFRLGLETDTQDTTGNVLETHSVSVGEIEVKNALGAFRGKLSQLPPMYSAIKIGGRKLYELARRGDTIDRPPREIEIKALELLEFSGDEGKLFVRCSKGTYVRTLCHDLGKALGCGAAMSSLRRVACGGLRIERAVTLAEIEKAAEQGRAESLFLPTDSVFSEYPALTIDALSEKKCRNGGEGAALCPDGVYRVYSETGEFLMLGSVRDGHVKTIKNFFEVNP